MNPIQSIVLGVVQGLTEFLPVSSSAHLILTPYFLNWADPGLAYDVALHMGTLAAIILFFWRDWAALLKQFFTFLKTFNFKKSAESAKQTAPWHLLVLGTIPAGIAGLLFERQAEETFRSPLLIAGTLATFGLLLGYFDRNGSRHREISAASPASVQMKDALLIGLAQALAIVPGVSRSGVTITMALALGFARPAAMRFSFLLSAPIIAGAGILKMKYILTALSAGGPLAESIAYGFLASLTSGMLAIGLLSSMAKARTFKFFVGYRLALALIIVVVITVIH